MSFPQELPTPPLISFLGSEDPLTVDANVADDLTALPALRVAPTRRRVGEDWRVDAICRQLDPDWFFPDAGDNAVVAKRVCFAVCPVQEECLTYALEWGEKFGIWGGMSTKERDRHARRLALPRCHGAARVARWSGDLPHFASDPRPPKRGQGVAS